MPSIQLAELDTPCYVFDREQLATALSSLQAVRSISNVKVLYSLKALCLDVFLEDMKDLVDGFSASSLHEVLFAREFVGDGPEIQLTTPGLDHVQVDTASEACNVIVFNSLSHLARHANSCMSRVSVGLRVNPGISLVDDARYDPCATHSKLGAALADLKQRGALPEIDGLHFHNSCDAIVEMQSIDLR